MVMSRSPCVVGELLELGQAGHAGLVRRDELAQHPGRVHAGRGDEVDGGLGVPGPLEHAARAVAQGEDVARTVELDRAGCAGR